MRDGKPLRIPRYAGAWLLVFFATIVSGVLACASIVIVSSIQLPGQVPSGLAGAAQIATLSIVFGGIVAVPVGLLSAKLCAFFIRIVPVRRVILQIVLPSIVVGVLTAPIFHVFSAVLVLFTQLIASLLISGPEIDQDSDESSHCASCGYSLAGLDRAKTTVCPECGEALPVKSEAEEEEKKA